MSKVPDARKKISKRRPQTSSRESYNVCTWISSVPGYEYTMRVDINCHMEIKCLT